MNLKFFSTSDLALYQKYRELKANIFIKEMQWEGLELTSDCKIAKADEHDNQSVFLGCLTNSGSLIGMIRGTVLANAFPHRELFTSQLEKTQVEYLERNGFTMNGLAVERTMRGYSFEYKGSVYKSIGRALIFFMSQQFYEKGYETCIVTALEGASLKVFKEVGFCTMGDIFLSNKGYKRFVNLYKINPSNHGEALRKFQRTLSETGFAYTNTM
ncbi:MAG: hypothetical protein N0E54_06330 [Candidatus Thiodiazotropha taylori]|nr:hypothetical protein [Candidatus Thiodiazotropha endolucinida]MCW4228337.1 hypothetical protein [Candidatus Thiodiazotropha taylori]